MEIYFFHAQPEKRDVTWKFINHKLQILYLSINF